MRVERVSAGGTVRDVAWLLLVAPVLVFPDVKPVLTVVILVAFLAEAARRLLSREWAPPTPLAVPLAIVLAMALVGTAVSSDPSVSVQKLAGLLLGVLVLQVTDARCRTTPGLIAGIIAVVVLGAGATAVGVVAAVAGMDAGLPARQALQRTVLSATVHPNALAGLILMAGPGLLVLLFSPAIWSRAGTDLARRYLPAWASPMLLRSLLAAICIAMLVTLVLSRSRSGIAGLAIALFVVLFLRLVFGGASRGTRAAAMAALVVALVTLGVMVIYTGSRLVTDVTTRADIWSRAVMMIAAFPLTGVGLGAFRSLVPLAAPLHYMSPGIDVAHAHNVFLQTALDTGIPGLCAYLALLGIALVMCVRVVRGTSPARRDLALALTGNVIAVHLFGLTDAIPLGAKVGLLLWLNLGLLSALHAIEHHSRTSQGVGATMHASARVGDAPGQE